MKTILFVAGGIESLPGIQLAKKMGLYVVVSDGDSNAPGFEYSDGQIIASTYDIDGTVQKAQHYHNTVKKLDGVICIASDVPLTVASVAKKLNLPGIPIEAAELAIDKMAMKNNFYKDDIPVPDFKQLHNIEDLNNTIKDWKYPLVIKPLDSRGARGVLRLIEGVDLDWAYNCALENSPTGRVMVEKYLPGAQVSTESILIESECYTVGFADRNYEYLDKYSPHIIENGGELPSNLPKTIQDQIKALVKKAALSMGIKNGIVKGDIVVYKKQPFIIELAARLSGGYFCTHEIPINTGVDLVGNAIKMAIGEKVDTNDLIPRFNKYICQRYIFPKPGTIQKINGLDNLMNNSSIEYFNIHAKPGQTIEGPTAHPSRAGMVIASGDSTEQARQAAINAIKSLTFSY